MKYVIVATSRLTNKRTPSQTFYESSDEAFASAIRQTKDFKDIEIHSVLLVGYVREVTPKYEFIVASETST